MIKKLLSRMKLSKNKKSVAKISTGTLLGQIISLITLPFLTRIYGADIFGAWAFLNAIAVIINSYSDIGLSYSLMVVSKENLIRNYRVISTLSIVTSTASSLVMTVVYIFFFDDIGINPTTFFVILFLISFMAQQIQICYTWLNRMENYNVLMKNPVLNQIVYGVVGILLGMLGFIQYGFFIAHIIGSFVTLINMKRNLPKGLLTFNYNEVFITLKENKNFAIFQMPTNITSNLKSQAPTLLIKVLWGTEILGYYSMTIRILQVPISLLSKAIGRVFFQVISKIKRQGKNIGEYVINNLLKAMKISIVPISLLVAFGDIVTIAFLGDEWEIAGDFVRILALQYFFMFLQGSVQGLAITLDKQKYAMIANISQVVGLFISTLVGKYTFDSIHITLILIALFYIVIQTVYFSSLFKLMNIAIARYIKSIIVGVIVIAALSTVLRRMFNYLELVNILNNI